MTQVTGVTAPVAPQADPPLGPAPPPGFASVLAAHLPATGRPSALGVPAPAVTLGEMVALQARAHPLTVPGQAPAATAAQVGAAQPVEAPPAGAGGRVVDGARRYLGVPYRWGGTDPATGLDCSGFVQRVFADLGVSVPRVSRDQSSAGVAVGSLAQARPGDLVYWNGTAGRPNHIGIYLGDGTMIHAPRTGDVVKVAPVRSAPPDAIRRVA